jgi:transcriptional regulator with XRE-family HTH domain
MVDEHNGIVIERSAVERIKRVRKAAGMTLAEVGKRAGLLPEAVARAERAGIDPRASTVAAIAKALRVPVCELFEEPGHGRFKETGHERQRRQRLGKP